MRTIKNFKIRPLTCLMVMSFMGCLFFTVLTTLVLVFFDVVRDYLEDHYKAKIDNMIIFIVLCGFHAFAFFIITIKLLVAKPYSRKVIIPLVIAATTAFLLLVAIDFYIEIHMLHLPPKALYTQSSKTEEDTKKTKKGKGFKLGYIIIYSSMCVVAWFLFLAYKNLDEEIESQKRENEPMEITISHIT